MTIFVTTSLLFRSYPPEKIIYRSYNERCSWEKFKNKELKTTVERIQEKYIRHNKSFKENMPEPKKPLTPARMGDERSAHEKFDEFLSFAYNSHKVLNSDSLEGGLDSSPFVTKIGQVVSGIIQRHESQIHLNHLLIKPQSKTTDKSQLDQ